jgi:hypothetical protein
MASATVTVQFDDETKRLLDAVKTVEAVRHLDLQPGQALLITVPDDLNLAARDLIYRSWAEAFPRRQIVMRSASIGVEILDEAVVTHIRDGHVVGQQIGSSEVVDGR